MKYEVNITDQATLDLYGIYEYIIFQLKMPNNANKQLDRLEKKLLSLIEFLKDIQNIKKNPGKVEE